MKIVGTSLGFLSALLISMVIASSATFSGLPVTQTYDLGDSVKITVRDIQGYKLEIGSGSNKKSYNIGAELKLGESNHLGIETGLTANSPDEDFGDKIFLEAFQGSIEYNLVFKDRLDSGSYISDASDERPVILRLGGKEIKIISATSDSITVSESGKKTTYYDGSEYIIPCGVIWHTGRCNKDDPDWTWVLSKLDNPNPIIGVEFNERVDSPDDNVPMASGSNNIFDIPPAGFTDISLKTNDIKYLRYEITDRIKDIFDVFGNRIESGSRLLEIKGGDPRSISLTTSGKEIFTDSIYLSINKAGKGTLILSWNDGGVVREAASIDVSEKNFAWLRYGEQKIPLSLESKVVSASIKFDVKVGDDLAFYVQESDGIAYVGHSDSDTVQANDIVYRGRDISGWEEDTMTADGIKILDPDANAPSDRYIFMVPSAKPKVTVTISSDSKSPVSKTLPDGTVSIYGLKSFSSRDTNEMFYVQLFTNSELPSHYKVAFDYLDTDKKWKSLGSVYRIGDLSAASFGDGRTKTLIFSPGKLGMVNGNSYKFRATVLGEATKIYEGDSFSFAGPSEGDGTTKKEPENGGGSTTSDLPEGTVTIFGLKDFSTRDAGDLYVLQLFTDTSLGSSGSVAFDYKGEDGSWRPVGRPFKLSELPPSSFGDSRTKTVIILPTKLGMSGGKSFEFRATVLSGKIKVYEGQTFPFK